MRKQRIALKNRVYVAPVRGDVRYIRTVKKQGAAGGGFKTGYNAQGRGFAASAWPQQRQELFLSNVKVYAVQYDFVVKYLMDFYKLNQVVVFQGTLSLQVYFG